MKILLTGFEAFGGMPVNPSQVIAESISSIEFKSNFEFEVITYILPVDFSQAGKRVIDLIDEHRPDYFIATGVDLSKPQIELEQRAHKIDTYIDDELRAKLINFGIDFDLNNWPKQVESKISLDKIQIQLSSELVPSIVSYDSGKYVCNHVYYIGNLLAEFSTLSMSCFFVHLPYPYSYWINNEQIIPSFTIAHIQKIFLEIITSLVESHFASSV